ncbi:DUF2795 domain-containing protein [Lentzea sp. NPDC051208]|uniref:DUF2795 domain-containing protein n=1 Tax=Lentzea sp. NPDC051208 TaxID=3154642 RepID=UPI00343929D2
MENSNTVGAVTRIEIIDATESAFSGASASKQEIITAAVKQESSTDLVSLLERLPDRQFAHVRDLWTYLPEVPIGD